MGPDAMIFVFWMLSFKPTFSLSSFTFIKRLFSSSSLSAIRVLSSACFCQSQGWFPLGLSGWSSLLSKGLSRVLPSTHKSKPSILLALSHRPQWFWSTRKKKICHGFHFSPIYLPRSDGTRCHDLSFFWKLSFKPVLSLSSFILIRRLFSSSLLSAIRVLSSAYLRLLKFLWAILTPPCEASSLAWCTCI